MTLKTRLTRRTRRGIGAVVEDYLARTSHRPMAAHAGLLDDRLRRDVGLPEAPRPLRHVSATTLW